MKLKERVLATMKSEDTESAFELYVTRTPGYLWALFFRALHVHPIAITLMSIVIGAAAGVFFYFGDLKLNLIGMLLLIWANWYDCADGQLARMTNQRTLIGRLLDGLAGDIWFFFIYWAIALRTYNEYGWWWQFIVFSYAGFIAHARQCAVSDYYRNIHLWFQLGKERSELDTFANENARYHELTWTGKGWFEKLYLFFYRGYTHGQESHTPEFQKFFKVLNERYPENIPEDLRQRFRKSSQPLMKYTNILTFDTRVGVLFLTLFIGKPWIYPLFELAVLEPLRYWMIRRHEGFCREYRLEIEGK